MSHKPVFSPFQKIIKAIANLVCRLGGLPTITQLETQLQLSHRQFTLKHEQQQALYRVINKIRASLDLDYIFRTTTKETCKLLQVERIAVYQFSEDWGGKFISDFEFAESNWENLETLGDNTVWNDSYLQDHQGGRYRYHECLFVSNIRTAGLSQCHVEILEQFHIQAYATAPIFLGEQLWGILAAYQHSRPRTWQDHEIRFLAQVADQLGVAVKQAQLMAQAQQRSKDLRLANDQQTILLNIIAEIRESLDINTLFHTTTREVRKALRTDRVGIFQFDANSNYGSGKFVAENVLSKYDSVMTIRVEDHCFGDRYAPEYHQGRMQVLSDITKADLKECHLNVLQQFQIKAQIVVPLMQADTLWGLLCVHQCQSPRHWTPAEISFIKQLAAQFSVALSHASLLAQYRAQTVHLNQAIEQLQQANEKLEKLTNVDALTQVSNRRFFDEVLEKEWDRLGRSRSYLSLILFDIDFFKAYNDYYGHPAGDQCLFAIAQAALVALKRSTDVLARYGGEEFAVILPETDHKGAIQVAKRIHATINQLQLPHQGSPETHSLVTISLGIASQMPIPGQLAKDLIAQADKALYKAKNQGRNRWICATPE